LASGAGTGTGVATARMGRRTRRALNFMMKEKCYVVFCEGKGRQ
jgi:hypothetical protein